MDRQTDMQAGRAGQKDRWMDRQTCRHAGQKDMDGWTDRHAGRQAGQGRKTDGWTDRHEGRAGQKDGWMDRQPCKQDRAERQMDGQTDMQAERKKDFVTCAYSSQVVQISLY